MTKTQMAKNKSYTGGRHAVGTPTIGKEGYFQMIKKIRNATMPYSERLKNYEIEKQKLFERIASMTASEVADAHRALVDKWGV